ncbi:amino acid adenylation domain-containing protein [Amycolatopsis sp. cg5]|uniref:amino acid adenylation domain-containing protein n=1 Tax=Amycolatopsis sp. cg5 TaxID=3238802 RepID=UPI0035258201
MGELGKTVHARFETVARQAFRRTAVVHGTERLTYGELDRRANRLAHHLIGLGARPGTIVGLTLGRGAELIVAMLAVLKAGAAYLPIDPAYPAERIASTLADAKPITVLTDGAEHDLPPGLPETAPAGRGVEPLDCAYVIYTSGSTGRPKGVQVTHRNLLALLDAAREVFDFSPDDVWTMFHSAAFDFSVWEIWGPLLTGGSTVVVGKETAWSPPDFARLLRDEKVTVLSQTPSAFYQLMPVAGPQPSLRTVVFGGEALDVGRLAPWHQRHGKPLLVNMYGITETTVHVTWLPLRPDTPAGSPIGAPLPGFTAHLLDDRLAPVPDGSIGELYVGGDQVARGYLGKPGLTSGRFVANPFGDGRLYRTGDLARREADGLRFEGRADSQVKIRGFRIELGEVESALIACRGVSGAAVSVRDDTLVAYLVGDEIRIPDVRARLAETLPAHMVPAHYVVLDRLPLTPNKKLDRAALPSPISDKTAARRELLRRKLAVIAEGAS